MGAVASATVYRRNGASWRPGMLTSWKTSHGPEKSIITAPSETRKATGILPWTGGLSGFALTAGLFPSEARVASAGRELAESSPITESANAAIKPNSAAVLSNPVLCMVFVRSFMTLSCRGVRLAAMTIIIIFLPRHIGKMRNLHARFGFRVSNRLDCWFCRSCRESTLASLVFPKEEHDRKVMAKKMRAVQVPHPKGLFEIVEREVPEPQAGWVRIKVQACGICHSDSLVKEGTWPGIQYPRVPGHEVIGVLDAVGPEVADWKSGQRVGIGWHASHCGHCDPCRRGDFFACQVELLTTGISFDGGYAEYMVAPAKALAYVPDDLNS